MGVILTLKPKPSMRAAVFVTCNQLTMNPGWVFWLASVPMMVHKPWRYFPENLMGKDPVDYLSGAIQGGEADNATLVYGGNPQLFPYKHNEGQFEVLVPLRNAKFAFQPDWPALTNLDIELDFINDGLWMKTDGVNLGGVRAK